MPITLIVNGIPFQYPVPGQEPGWGQGATDWANEVTVVLNDILGPNDISETTAPINNNQTSFLNLPGLIFNTGEVRAALINYSVYRTSTANPYGNSESGVLNIVYDNAAPGGSKWAITSSNLTGNSGITFTVLDSGQIQYKSTDINSTGYSGIIHFRAKTLGQ